MPVTYSTRQTAMPMNTNYYSAVPSSATAPVPMAQTYDPYPVPTQPPPMPHRPSSGAWSQQDDHNLLTARQQGLNWAQIQSTYFPTKSPNACRKRHERLLERRGADDWDARKLERLAKEYMSMRKEIWQGLAARTGDKWTVVEAKCMHNGLKNLQSASRSAARRERLEQGHSLNGYDDDSGISGIGLTPVDDLDASYSSPETTASSAHSQHSGGSGGYGMPHPYSSAAGYSSSYSSSVSSAAHGYAMHGHPHYSQDSSPYMGNGQRLPSVDMGIESIINRPSHGHNGGAPTI
ncbi:hypothetical protein NPX13_g6892 [Xylaria arbuscula]|uniref:Myb-like domain-containing protein n=1 Tax=Xylaria arbuscula TaxID=114810 RepID=A0A9W8NBL4_9PEZI|nr:hypothetical protein NPX13_g6892 [Xylaria arbuscula]